MMLLERRACTATTPMPLADKGKFYWIHGDATDAGQFLNWRLYTCPHCDITFHAAPRDTATATATASHEKPLSPLP